MILVQNHNVYRRSGAAIIYALAVISALMVFMVTTTKHLTSARHMSEARGDRMQAQWLARAGVEWAAARILSNPNGYEGETIEFIPDSQVQIFLIKDPQSADQFRVTSDARFALSRPGISRVVLHRTIRRFSESGTARVEVRDADFNP